MSDTILIRLSLGSLGNIFIALALFFMSFSLLSIKNKSAATIHLSLLMLGFAIQSVGNFIGLGIYSPLGAMYRYFVIGSLFGSIHGVHLFLNFPHNRAYPRLSKSLLFIQYIGVSIFYILYVLKTLNAEIVFYPLRGELFMFDMGSMDQYVAIILIINVIISFLVLFWRIITLSGNDRWVVFQLGIAFIFAFIITAYVNALNRYGELDAEMLVLTFGLYLIVGFVMFFIIYINHTIDRTTFMSKIIIINIITILTIFVITSLVLLRDAGFSYDALHNKEILNILSDRKYSSDDIKYLIAYDRDNDQLYDVIKNQDVSIDNSLMHITFRNSDLYESIESLDSNDFESQLRILLEKTHPYASGYKGYILQYLDVAKEKPNSSKTLLKYIENIAMPIDSRYDLISKLPNANFKADLTASLDDMFSDNLVPFKTAITDYLRTSKHEGSDLKKDILHFLEPVKINGKRYLRIDDIKRLTNHYTTYIYFDTNSNTIYEAGFSYRMFRDFVHTRAMTIFVLSAIIFVVVFLGFRIYFFKDLFVPLNRLMDGVRKVNDGNLSINIPIQFEDEFGYLSRSFNGMTVSIRESREKLQDYANHLEDMVHEKTKELNEANKELNVTNKSLILKSDELGKANKELAIMVDTVEKARKALWGEMEIAKKIQTVLLPRKPAIDGYEITAYMKPADEVGGDYYDIIHVDDKDWILIGDVSGHGVTAGLIMMMVQTSIHTVVENCSDMQPSNLLGMVNKVLYKNIKLLGEDMFMTITALACHKDGTFYFSGNHQKIMIYRSGTGVVDQIDTHGMWIGIIEDIFDDLRVSNLEMKSGDVMLLYTDGIIEAVGNNEEMFSEQRLSKILQQMGSCSTEEIKNEIMNELKEYSSNDDVTMVVMKSL